VSPNDGEEKIKYYVLKEEVEQKIRYYAIKIEELLRDITILQNRWEEDTWKNESSIFVTGKEITFPYVHEAKLFMEETQNTDITIRNSYPTYHVNYKKLLPPFLDLFMFALPLFLFLTAAYSVFVLMPQIGHGHNYMAETMFSFYMLFGLVFLLFYPFYVIYDWLPALYGGNIIKNLIDTILSYLEPLSLFPPEESKIMQYINSALPETSPLITVLIIPQTIFYTVLSLIATRYITEKHGDLTFLYAIPPFFFTITLGRAMIVTQNIILITIFALIMQYIIFALIYKAIGDTDSILGMIIEGIFFFPLLPYLAGLGYVVLFMLFIFVLLASSPINTIKDAIKSIYVFLLKNREYKNLLNELGKELETYATLKKQSISASQQTTETSKASQQSSSQEAKVPTTQESQKACQQSLTTPQQTVSQITTETSPQITAQQSSTAQQVQATPQQPNITSQQTPAISQSSQQIPQSASQQQISPPITPKQTSEQQINIQKQTAQQSRPLQVMPLADMLIKHFEKALNHIQSIQGNPSEIYYRSVVLSYYNIINMYLRKIYYGEPLKFHHLIQYFMVRGLISKELGENLLDLSRKYWRLQNDPSFTVNQEFMQRVKSTAYQLLNELKNKKEKLEILLIEKKAHEGKLRL